LDVLNYEFPLYSINAVGKISIFLIQSLAILNYEFLLQLLAVKKELSDLQLARTGTNNENPHHSDPSSPADSASAALNNFDEANIIPLSTSNGKASHRNSIDKKPVVDWV